jgi:hypothetical protein
MTCHDYHGVKWKNINIYQILIVFLCDQTPFLVHWIMIAPKARILLDVVDFPLGTINNESIGIP